MVSYRPPNLVLAGFSKCGTTSLADLLVSHPEISLNQANKEPHTYSLTKKYKQRFNNKNNHEQHIYSLDASTTYAVSEMALKRLYNDNPDTKILFILRDPVERVISHYNWYSKMGLRLLPIHRELEIDRGEWRENEHINYNWKFFIDFSLYAKHIIRAKETFDSVHLIYLEDLESEQSKTLQSVFDWLGLQEKIDLPKKHIANKTNEIKRKSTRNRTIWTNQFPATITKVFQYYVEPYLRYGSFKLLNRKATHTPLLRNQILAILSEDIKKYKDAGIDINKFATVSKSSAEY